MAFGSSNIPTISQNNPLAQRSDFYKANGWQDPGYDKFGDTAGATAKGLYDRASGMDPTKAGGFLSDFASYKKMFGINSYNPLDPTSEAQMGAGMANLGGDRANLLQNYAKAAASGSVTSGRGGFGVNAGGAGPEAVAQQNAMSTAAGQYGTDYKTIAGLLNQSAGIGMQGAGQYADAYMKMLQANLQAGGQLTAEQLQAIQGKDASYGKWRDQAGAAYGSDVQDANTWQQGAQDRIWKEQQRQQQTYDSQFKRDQSAYNLQQFKDMSTPGTAAYNQVSGPRDPRFDYYQTQVGLTDPWKRNIQLSGKAYL